MLSGLGCSPGLGGFRLLCAAARPLFKLEGPLLSGPGWLSPVVHRGTAVLLQFKVEESLGEINVGSLPEVRPGMRHEPLGLSALRAFQHQQWCG